MPRNPAPFNPYPNLPKLPPHPSMDLPVVDITTYINGIVSSPGLLDPFLNVIPWFLPRSLHFQGAPSLRLAFAHHKCWKFCQPMVSAVCSMSRASRACVNKALPCFLYYSETWLIKSCFTQKCHSKNRCPPSCGFPTTQAPLLNRVQPKWLKGMEGPAVNMQPKPRVEQ